MNKAITLSLSDPAGQTMLPIFKEHGFKETEESNVLMKGDKYLFAIEPLIVPEERFKMPPEPRPYPTDYDKLAARYEVEYMVVASKHWAQSGNPSLTVHPTGNFGKAMYGGHHYELQPTAPNPMRDVYLRLLQNPPEGFQVSLEATHHSPTQFKVPMFFAEVGSREDKWRDETVCRYLVDSILKGMDDEGEAQKVIGFGGGHYCPTFSESIREYAMGHMAAKYTFHSLTENLVTQMKEKSMDAEAALLDKGLKGKDKRKILALLGKLEIPVL
ncbi:MAG: D-aminoacyl-tRNA deacylase [Candidatus Bathyarchaeota archaeon]|nr:D-aminoacyl-tRNA deacylase [Candidatus Bathyarchaeota archaeon]